MDALAGSCLTIVLDADGHEICRLLRPACGQPAIHGAELQRVLLDYGFPIRLIEARGFRVDGSADDMEIAAVARHIITHFRDGRLVADSCQVAFIYTIHPVDSLLSGPQLCLGIKAGRLDGTTLPEQMVHIFDDSPIESFMAEVEQERYGTLLGDLASEDECDDFIGEFESRLPQVFQSASFQPTETTSQIRVNELARELEVKAQAIIDYLPEAGVTEKMYHSSGIGVIAAAKVRKHFRDFAESMAAGKEETTSNEKVKDAANRESQGFTLPNKETSGQGRMGLNWLWYAPLAIWVILNYGIYNVILAYRNVRTILQFPHPWLVFLSPSAYVFAFASVLNFWTPSALVLIIYMCFAAEKDSDLYRKRYRWTVLAVVGIFVVVMVTSFLIWGSFPFEVSPNGEIVMRMIPLIPWPHHPPVQ